MLRRWLIHQTGFTLDRLVYCAQAVAIAALRAATPFLAPLFPGRYAGDLRALHCLFACQDQLGWIDHVQ